MLLEGFEEVVLDLAGLVGQRVLLEDCFDEGCLAHCCFLLLYWLILVVRFLLNAHDTCVGSFCAPDLPRNYNNAVSFWRRGPGWNNINGKALI